MGRHLSGWPGRWKHDASLMEVNRMKGSTVRYGAWLVMVWAVVWMAALLPSSLVASEDLLARVKTSGLLRVSNTQASPPWSFIDERNQVSGYDVDVANDLAKRMSITRVEFIASNFQNFIPGVQSDRFDIVIAGQTVTEERRTQVDFSIPYQVNGVSIFVNAANDAIKGQPDLAGKRIGVSAGSTQERFARERIPNADVRTYENAILALTDLHIGRIDAALFSRFVGAYLAERNRLKVKPVPDFLNFEINAMSFKRGQSTFKAEVDRSINAMIADRTLTSISKKWLGGLDMAEELKRVVR